MSHDGISSGNVGQVFGPWSGWTAQAGADSLNQAVNGWHASFTVEAESADELRVQRDSACAIAAAFEARLERLRLAIVAVPQPVTRELLLAVCDEPFDAVPLDAS